MAKIKNLEDTLIKESDLISSGKQHSKTLIKKDILNEVLQISILEENNSNLPDNSDDMQNIFSQ
ncbi:MAG: hypothetical protein IPM96_20255 [Ignavibacteria bacterium]|nr:hypothetical protein [Ignavibacteria bacterium]